MILTNLKVCIFKKFDNIYCKLLKLQIFIGNTKSFNKIFIENA